MRLKYDSDSNYNKFTSDVLDLKIQQKGLFKKPYISNFAKNSDLNTKFSTLATKAELKVEQDSIMKLQTHDLSF